LIRREIREQLRQCLADDVFYGQTEGFTEGSVCLNEPVIPVGVKDACGDGVQYDLQIAAVPLQFLIDPFLHGNIPQHAVNGDPPFVGNEQDEGFTFYLVTAL
jgi:hypothetical protein